MSLPVVYDAVNRALNGKKPKGRNFTVVVDPTRTLKVWTATAKNVSRNMKKLSPNVKTTKTGRKYKVWTNTKFRGPSGAKYTISSALQRLKKK
jgi:alkyl hydroperoxide reductase subunit AhpC